MSAQVISSSSQLPWWRAGVVYEIPVASFADSNGDGYGDLPGILGKLDYLRGAGERSLGVDAIWLTPIGRSPMRDFGYDVANYCAIEPRFGTMDDFDELLRACHDRGLRLVTDLVLNHTSDEHPWFVQSRKSTDNPKRDWYIWRDGRAPGKPPNRWVSVAEGGAWKYDIVTDQYYYHAFLPFQPDLNWRNAEVRAAMFDVARFWLEKGVDGFRLDLINFLYEDEQLRDNTRRLGWRPYFWQNHDYDRSRPESVQAVKDLRALADSFAGERALLGEVFTDVDEDVTAYLGNGSDALHLSFYLDFARCPWSARRFRASVDWLEAHLPDHAWPCYYLNNHDLSRTFTRLGGLRHGEARAKVAAAMLLTLRGTPILYAGEELGMRTSTLNPLTMKDPLGRSYWPVNHGRDGCRTPMQWTPGPQAGFTTGQPWLPVDRSHTRVNVESEDSDPKSLLNWYRALIRLRSERPALHSGSYRALDGTPRGVYAYVREHASGRVAVFLNFTPWPARVSVLTDAGDWTPLLSTHEVDAATPSQRRVRLRPHEVLLLSVG
jgi:alpha-glucosidase